MIVGPALARGYKLLPDFSYEPWLFSKDCTVLAKSPFTVDCTIRPEAKWSDGVADHRRRLQVHVRHDHEPEEQRRHPQRLRQDHRVQRRQPDRVPDGVQADVHAVPRPVGGHEHRGAAEARARGHGLQQGLEHAASATRRRSKPIAQRPDARAVVHAGPADHPRAEPELLGEARRRCRRSCSSRSPTATARSTRSAPARST